MVSRRKILSRSRDDLNLEQQGEEEDVWNHREKLFMVGYSTHKLRFLLTYND